MSNTETTVTMFDYLRHHATIEPEIQSAIKRVLDSGWLVLGPEVKTFEEAFSHYLNFDGYCIGVNSGTDALTIALRSLNIGLGDEVITVSNTAVPTVSAIREVGATPVFCDIDPATSLMDITKVTTATTSKTRAVIPVHLFGNMVDIPKLRNELSTIDASIAIIEDCAQSQGAKIDNQHAGTLGDISAFSFYPTKNLGAYGDGGMIACSSKKLADKIRRIRMYGFEKGHYSEEEGVNSRLDELQAAILGVKLRYLPQQVDNRRRIAHYYDTHLHPSIQRLSPAANVHHAYHLYVVRVNQRDKLRETLAKKGISTGIHYQTPIHLMRGYQFLGIEKGRLPETEKAAAELLSLPMFPELYDDELAYVCECINQSM